MMRNRSALFLVFAVFLLLPATPASAHISAFTYDFNTATCADPPDCDLVSYDTAQGTITCASGERFQVLVKIIDSPSYAGKGITRGTCTGSSQNWTVTFTNESGVGDIDCPLRYAAKAKTKADGTFHDEESLLFEC